MSSEWAPRHMTCKGRARLGRKVSMRSADVAWPRRLNGPGNGGRLGAVAAPDFPRGLAAGIQVFERHFFLERVHRVPEPVVLVRGELVHPDQPLEALDDELFALVQVIEDLRLEREEPAVHPDVGLGDRLDVDDVTGARGGADDVERLAGADRYERRELVGL